MSNQPNESLPVLAILGGTGKEGPGLAMRWAIAGYPVIIGSRQIEKAKSTADELNLQLGLSTVRGMENREAARAADICVLTVLQSAHQSILESLREDLQGKILIDATARVDFRDPHPPAPPAAALYAQKLLGQGVRVVAAFQNIPAHALRHNLGEKIPADVLVCSDDIRAAQSVIELARCGGMRAFYAGGLENAIVVEGLTAVLIAINKHYKIKTASIFLSGVEADNHNM